MRDFDVVTAEQLHDLQSFCSEHAPWSWEAAVSPLPGAIRAVCESGDDSVKIVISALLNVISLRDTYIAGLETKGTDRR